MPRKFTFSFERYEMKYLLNREQKEKLLEFMESYMKPDTYLRSSIRNVYFDTPDRRLIINSLDNTGYKEKLRIRSYGSVTENDKVFVELKRKKGSTVYKRRVLMTNSDALDFLFGGIPSEQSQIINEISYFMDFYEKLEPSMFISYDRDAFVSRNDINFRMTFDSNILWRDTDMSLLSEPYGNRLLDPDTSILEIKTASPMPLWVTAFLSENNIFRNSYSKYGAAFTEQFRNYRRGVTSA